MVSPSVKKFTVYARWLIDSNTGKLVHKNDIKARDRAYRNEVKNYCKPTVKFQYTVKPLMLACPLIREFREPNKTAKLKGANINCRPK